MLQLFHITDADQEREDASNLKYKLRNVVDFNLNILFLCWRNVSDSKELARINQIK